MQETVNYCNNLIEELWNKGFKTYITKGTGRSEIVREDKAVILDLASPNFRKNAETARELVHQIWIQEQIKKAKQKYVSM